MAGEKIKNIKKEEERKKRADRDTTTADANFNDPVYAW